MPAGRETCGLYIYLFDEPSGYLWHSRQMLAQRLRGALARLALASLPVATRSQVGTFLKADRMQPSVAGQNLVIHQIAST